MTTEKSIQTGIAPRDRDARLNSILRAAPVGVGVVINRCFTEVNDRFCEMTGYTADELLGQSSRMLYPTDEEFDCVGRVKYGQIRRTGIGTIETRFRRKDNEIIDVLLSSSPIDADTGAGGVTFTALDITERKRAEEALEESREKYRSIFEHSPEMIVLLDANGMLIEANNKVEELLLYDRSELLGEHFDQFPFWSNETKDGFSEVFRRRLSGSDIAPYELEFLPRIGCPLTCWVHGTSLRDGAGTITHVLLILTDVTDQRRAERALREEEGRARDYLDVAGVILIALDLQQRVTLINRKGCAVLRRSEKEIIGRNWLDIAIPTGQREICKIVYALLVKGDTQAVEYFENSVVTGDGVKRMIAWRNTVVRDASGAIVGTLSSGEDITERKQAEASLRDRTAVLEREVAERRRAEEQLRESREDFRRLAGKVLSAQESERSRIARELHDDITQRLALMAIEAANVKRTAPELSEAGRAKLDALQRRLENVAADVQAVSRVLHPSILKDLGLEDAVASECVAFQSREGIETTTDVGNLPSGVADEAALCLFRILQEALWNIAKHSCAENVRVSLHCQDGQLVLAVGDDGIGFDVDQARKQRGMGLASMQERAHLVGGALSIDSQPDMGTMIEARVPLSEPPK